MANLEVIIIILYLGSTLFIYYLCTISHNILNISKYFIYNYYLSDFTLELILAGIFKKVAQRGKGYHLFFN